MFKKIFIFCIKMIPLITLYKGITSGSNKMVPLLNIGKVAITQQEVSQLAKLVGDDYVSNRGELIHPDDFPIFVLNNYNNQYSALIRKVVGGDQLDVSKDIWGNPFKLVLNEAISKVSVVSAGPDGKYQTNDDIGLGFKITFRAQATPVSKPMESEEIYDADGFDSKGFDRQGRDNDGYDRDGFDNNGYDRDGFDQDGQPRREE